MNFIWIIFLQLKLSAKEKRSGWDDSYFKAIGLNEFVEEGYIRIGGNKICDIGERLGRGLTEEAANQMNLPHSRIAVAVSVIDAHAGGLGVVSDSYSFPFDLFIDFCLFRFFESLER